MSPPPAAVISDDERRAIHEVLERRLVHVAFQPIVRFDSGEVFAYEALARPDHPAFAGPLPLFAAAEAEGLCGPLGRLLRQLSVEGCPDTRLFLNIHPRELDEGYLVRPDDALYLHDLPVYLEITESLPLHLFPHYKATLAEVKSRGVRIAIDDLGAGYSNLKYIADLEPAVVKIDRDLVTAMHLNERLIRLVQSIVRLCESLDAEVVAEGIETVEEYEVLREVGVHYGQGYLLARPAFPPPPLAFPVEKKR